MYVRYIRRLHICDTRILFAKNVKSINVALRILMRVHRIVLNFLLVMSTTVKVLRRTSFTARTDKIIFLFSAAVQVHLR